MYVYIESESWRDGAGTRHKLFTVGFYRVSGVTGQQKFESESDHGSREDAAARVHYLNGGCSECRS